MDRQKIYKKKTYTSETARFKRAESHGVQRRAQREKRFDQLREIQINEKSMNESVDGMFS